MYYTCLVVHCAVVFWNLFPSWDTVSWCSSLEIDKWFPYFLDIICCDLGPKYRKLLIVSYVGSLNAVDLDISVPPPWRVRRNSLDWAARKLNLLSLRATNTNSKIFRADHVLMQDSGWSVVLLLWKVWCWKSKVLERLKVILFFLNKLKLLIIIYFEDLSKWSEYHENG